MNVFEETPCRLHAVVNIFEEAPCNDKGSGRSQEDIFKIYCSIFVLDIDIFKKCQYIDNCECYHIEKKQARADKIFDQCCTKNSPKPLFQRNMLSGGSAATGISAPAFSVEPRFTTHSGPASFNSLSFLHIRLEK